MKKELFSSFFVANSLLRVIIQKPLSKELTAMEYPEWAIKFKTKNTELRLIRGRYYLYNITSKWDPEKKRTKKVTLGAVGTITEEHAAKKERQSIKGLRKLCGWDDSTLEGVISNPNLKLKNG